jgi:hypothetical protein
MKGLKLRERYEDCSNSYHKTNYHGELVRIEGQYIFTKHDSEQVGGALDTPEVIGRSMPYSMRRQMSERGERRRVGTCR